MANWGVNHGSLTYGHIGRGLITLASMLRISRRDTQFAR